MTDIAHFPRPGQNYPYMSVAMFCLLLYLLCLCAGPILSHAPPAAAGRSQKWIVQWIYNCDLALTLVRLYLYHTAPYRTLVPPGTHIALLAALSIEQWRSWSNLRTNPDTCIVPTLSFLLLWFPGRAGLLSIGSQRTNTDLISAQILFQSEHKSWHLLPDARCAVFSTIVWKNQPCTTLYVSNYLFLVTPYMGGWCLSLHLPSSPIVFDLRVEKHHNE